MALVLALAAIATPIAGAASPAGGGNAFNELTKETETSTAPKTTSTFKTNTSNESTSNSHSTILIAAGAAIVLLLAIGGVIVRDARRVAPAGEADVLERGAARDTAVRHRKRRAKAKAARAQRKRNR